MQNRNYLLLFFILVSSAVKAQETDSAVASVRYSFTHIMDSTQPDNPLKENMILYLGKNMSNYTSFDRIERMAKLKANMQYDGATVDIKSIDMTNVKSVSVDGGMVTIGTNGGGSSTYMINPGMSVVNSYFKDQSASKLSYMASAGQKIFAVEEKIPVIEWNITQETKEIKGLQCQKATGDFKGRSYEAWFCSQLPYNNGPWKLGGLPGLIIEAYDTKKEVLFEFTSFENDNATQTAIAIPKDAIATTPKDYKQYLEAMQRDRTAMSGATSAAPAGANITVSDVRVGGNVSGGTVTGPDGKPIKIRRMNNPVERSEMKK
jgi:GLPGLI family protein